MPKKVRCPSCSGGWCKNHLFELLPLKNSTCYYRKKMKLRLCPKHNNNSNNFMNSMPQINTDLKHYTPCFILQDQKNYYRQNNQKLFNNHNIKLQSEGDCTILVPKHGRKKNYCSVCKVEYEDYLQHTDETSHRLNLRSNRFSKLILETAREMKQQRSREIETPLFAPVQPLSKMMDETKDLQKSKLSLE